MTDVTPTSDEKDLVGRPRLANGRVDMGAFEYNDDR